jgi:signal transduction histidine kinase
MYLKVLKTKKPQIFVNELVLNNKRRVIENRIYLSKTGIAIFTKDITQQKNLQGKLEYTQRLEELVKIRTEKLKTAERLAAIGKTAGRVRHDIRNPLQTIAGELYLAKTEADTLPDGENKENLNESFTAIGRQLRYINKIVSDLLDYSKPMTHIME